MVATISAVLGLALAGLFGEPKNAMAEFGELYEFFLILCVANTLGALYFVWRIFREKPRGPEQDPTDRV